MPASEEGLTMEETTDWGQLDRLTFGAHCAGLQVLMNHCFLINHKDEPSTAAAGRGAHQVMVECSSW